MRAIVNLLLFLAAFAAVAFGIGAITPNQKVAIVTPKLAWIEQHADDYDVLFLGSSRTYRQIIPELFDQCLAEAGKPTRSFNLGVDGMRPPEDTYLLEKALASRTKPLKWVFVECNPLRLGIREEDRGTLRASYWHDTPRMLSIYHRAFLAKDKHRNWRERAGEAWESWPDFSEHADYWLQNVSCLGRGNALLENWIFKGEQPQIAMHDVGPRKDGYLPSSSAEQMSETQQANYQAELAEMRIKPPKHDPGDLASLRELEFKRQMIEKSGAKMVLLIPPFTASRFFHPQDATVFDFSNLEKFPQLFAPENRSDSGHVNRKGSELYTREVIRSFLDYLH